MDERIDSIANSKSPDTLALSYVRPICLITGMRKPKPIDLEFTMVLFLVLAPLGYIGMRAILELFS